MATKPKTLAAPKNLGGRPSTFSQAIVDEVCARVANGEPLAIVCREIGLGLTTWYLWARERTEVAEAIAHAREAGEDIILAETLTIIDTTPERQATAEGDKVDSGHVAWLKNRAEQRLKLLAKWNPRKWGDKVAVGGADDLPSIHVDASVMLDPSDAYKSLLGLK